MSSTKQLRNIWARVMMANNSTIPHQHAHRRAMTVHARILNHNHNNNNNTHPGMLMNNNSKRTVSHEDDALLNDWVDSCQRINDEHWDSVDKEMNESVRSPSSSPIGPSTSHNNNKSRVPSQQPSSSSTAAATASAHNESSPFDFI